MTASQDTKATQVGGTHYSATAARCPHCNGSIQHWDLYADAPGLIYSATKHITRHRAKGGKQDLLKAITEIQKIIEQEYPDVQDPGQPTDEEVMRAEWPDTRGGAAHVEAAHADPWSNMADAHMQDVCQHCGKIREMHFLDDHCYYADDSHKFEKTRELIEVTAPGSTYKEFIPVVNTSPEAARARADAFARARTDEDVPVGWVLKRVESSNKEYWCFRRTKGGKTGWSKSYPTRKDALDGLIVTSIAVQPIKENK